jgi:hypothetical protein
MAAPIASKASLRRPLAAIGVGAFACALTWGSSACLVTGTPTITGQIDCFPNFDPTSATPNVRDLDDFDIASTNVFTADISVVSCDPSTLFIGHVFVDKASAFTTIQIPQSGAERRLANVAFDFTGFAPRTCHLVELYASSSFDDSATDGITPTTIGDLARISWFVFLDPNPSDSDPNDRPSMSSCPQ